MIKRAPCFSLRFAAALLGLGCLVLAGCSKSDENAGQTGQVVARIGSDVVTSQELDNEFRLANVPNDKRRDTDTVKRVLGELVARKYLAQQAIAAKLDREPAVLLEILRSREQVLASAMLARDVNGKVSAISKADVDKYIANNPTKFVDREILNVDQIVIPQVPNLQAVVDATKDMNSLEDVNSKLTEMSIPHNRSSGALNTAALPDDLSNALKTKKPDDIFFVRSGQNAAFVKILSRETRPVEGPAADALARQLMRVDFFRSAASMASFSANNDAKYEGDYAIIMGDQGSQPQKKQ